MKPNQASPAQYRLALHVVEKGNRPKLSCSANIGIAEIGSEITFRTDILDTYGYEGWKSLHYDLLVVCAAVEFADRRWPRHVERPSRPFYITVPVLELRIWGTRGVQKRLCETLRHLTGDEWHFSFVQGEKPLLDGPRQRALPFSNNKQFAIAYSAGLDSRCVSGLFDTGDTVVRVRVSRNKDRVNQGECPFDRLPFVVKVDTPRESRVRSRGFKFAAVTAVAAHISRVSKIIVPESGQGALGPVLLPLHNIYPDYRNHPTFFRKMEDFIRELLGCALSYEQPRLWYTKAQTISAFLKTPGAKVDVLISTRSCWQQRWNARVDNRLRQCGLCAACVLRRMSMHAARVEEPSDTYTFADLTVPHYRSAIPRSERMRPSATMVDHAIVGVLHFQQLADMAVLPDNELQPHIFEIARATEALEHDTREKLRKLLAQHKEEWRDFLGAQGKRSFLNRWTGGGRNGRS